MCETLMKKLKKVSHKSLHLYLKGGSIINKEQDKNKWKAAGKQQESSRDGKSQQITMLNYNSNTVIKSKSSLKVPKQIKHG